MGSGVVCLFWDLFFVAVMILSLILFNGLPISHQSTDSIIFFPKFRRAEPEARPGRGRCQAWSAPAWRPRPELGRERGRSRTSRLGMVHRSTGISAMPSNADASNAFLKVHRRTTLFSFFKLKIPFSFHCFCCASFRKVVP